MRYLMLLHVDENGWSQLTPDQQAAGMAAYGAFNDALGKAGALVATGRLTPTARSTQIRTLGGRVVTTDGPYAETKEQIGGFYLIEAADGAAALDWARRCPAAGHGAVEVREVQ
jgi:hypothetical protein